MKTKFKTQPTLGTVLAVPALLALACATTPAGPLTSHDSAPALGAYDIAQLVSSSSDLLNINGPGKIDTAGNDASTYVANDRTTQGQLFTTGGALGNYLLSGIWVQHVLYTDELANGTWSGLNDGASITLRILDPSQADSAGFVLTSQVSTVAAGNGIPGGQGGAPYWGGTGKWLYLPLDAELMLAANTQYGFDLTSTGPWFELAGMDAEQYAGGSAYTTAAKFDLNPGTVHTGDRTFVVALTAVPEPASSALLLCGAGCLAAFRRSRRSRA
jgi:hypothetical protein